jgi:hypothetical protein
MTAITIDVKDVAALAGRLETITPERLGAGALRAVNESMRTFEREAQGRIIERVALTLAYVKSKTDLQVGVDPLAPLAVLTVEGPRRPNASGLTILGRYAPQRYQLTGARRRAGPVRGNRSAGVGVEITKGKPVFEPQWFLMKLKRGRAAGTDLGVFVRTTDDPKKPRHIYGPSPYSLTRQQIDRNIGEVTEGLRRLSLRYVADEVDEAL